MTNFGDRLARVLHDAVPEPPRELDPSAIRASATQHERRTRLLAPALAAAAVAAVAIGVPLAGHQLATQQRPGPRQPAVPSPPPGFTANEFRMAPPGVEMYIGGVSMPRATCTPQQISATAATRRTDGGVLGVIRLVGAVVSHRDGLAERCTLPIARGPSALIGTDGRRLKVPLSGGDPTSRPANPRPDIALNDGDAIWGFAWLGTYCGVPARAIELPLDHAGEASLRIPLRGPQPGCQPATGISTLIDRRCSRRAGSAATARLLEPAARRPDRARHHEWSARTHRPRAAHHRQRADHPRPLPRLRGAGRRDRPVRQLQRSHQLRLSPLHQPRSRDSPRAPAALDHPGDQPPADSGHWSDPRLDRLRPARHRRRATLAPHDNCPSLGSGEGGAKQQPGRCRPLRGSGAGRDRRRSGAALAATSTRPRVTECA